MTRKRLRSAIGCLAFLLLLAPPPAHCATDPGPQLRAAFLAQRECDAAAYTARFVGLAAGTVCVYGPIDMTTLAEFQHLAIPDDAMIVLNSNGGDVAAAIEIAFHMLDHHLHAVVWRFCLSSCANYLFPAGATKIVLPRSYVAWHGGPPKTVPASSDAAARIRYLHTLARQQALFDRIGVDPEIMYSPNPVSGVTQANRDRRLWSWTAEDLLVRFGVRDIVWMWQPERPTISPGPN